MTTTLPYREQFICIPSVNYMEEKKGDLTQSYDENHFTNRKFKKQLTNHNLERLLMIFV